MTSLPTDAFTQLDDRYWPAKEIAQVNSTPMQWIVVCEHQFIADHTNGGVSSYLVSIDEIDESLSTATWDGRSLGQASSWSAGDECLFSDGLVEARPQACHFFVQTRRPHSVGNRFVEFTPSFLWYFDALSRGDNSYYFIDDSGHDHDLARATLQDRSYRVEVNAMPLRKYLSAREMALIVQLDWVSFHEDVPDEPFEAEIREQWATYDFTLRTDRAVSSDKAHSRFLGKHAVMPLDVDPCEEIDFQRDDPPYPEFIYGVDENTGEHLLSTCREEELSNYFVDRGTPHYLTPVYFRRDVLTRYANQPSRYSVTRGSVSCLDLWSLRMDVTDDGLVEVFLGDLSKYLPASERDYWRSFNVPPAGGMREARFRSDFLAEWVDHDDPIVDLLRARNAANAAFEKRFGSPLFLPLHAEDLVAWEGIHLMTTSESTERDSLVTVLAKGITDSLDLAPLRRVAGLPSGKSLECLERVVLELGGEVEGAVEPLRIVQSMRSTGSAHSRGSNYAKLLAKTGFDELRPDEQFESLVRHSAAALHYLAELLEP